MPSVFTQATGQKIVLNVGVDISAATTKQIKFRRPDGVSSNWTAAEESTTSISYTTTGVTDLPIGSDGDWKLQAYVVTPTWSDHGDIARLTVKETL